MNKGPEISGPFFFGLVPLAGRQDLAGGGTFHWKTGQAGRGICPFGNSEGGLALKISQKWLKTR
jgi:hypothetical protein